MRRASFLFAATLIMGLTTPFATATDFAGGPSSEVVQTSTFKQHRVVTADLSVPLNKTKVLRLDQIAQTVIVGNPDIADVSVHSGNTLFVVGRGYGDTNLVILDGGGQTILDANINVSQSISANNVRLFNGTQDERKTYHCAPYCAPAPVLGDSPQFVGANSATSSPINTNSAAGAIAEIESQIGLAREAAPLDAGVPQAIFDREGNF